MRINRPVSNIERPVPEGVVLLSRTDLKGVITYCNQAFIAISGYSEPELVGSPHNLVRHPDVPPEIFADLWKTVQSGNPWNGIVKNRCKNGDHYWVEANVTPLLENGRTVGYVSLRYRASAEQIAAAERAYQAVREIEVEMSRVDYLDSSALGMLMLLNERAKGVSKSVSLLNTSGVVSQVLEVANFSRIFNIRNAS